MDKNSTKNIILVIFLVSVVCAILVSSVSVAFREQQKYNEKIKQWKEILNVLAIPYDVNDKSDIEAKFATVKTIYFDINAGKEVKNPTPQEIDPKLNFTNLTSAEDIAKIFRRTNIATIYMSFDANDKLASIAFPASGYGLWSVMYAYVALEPDLNTIKGVSFYKHAETPGLGGEIANPKWNALWVGKKIKTEEGSFRVIKGFVNKDDFDANIKVDGIAGSTLTSNGVTNMMKFWFNTDVGYGKFIQAVKSGEIELKK